MLVWKHSRIIYDLSKWDNSFISLFLSLCSHQGVAKLSHLHYLFSTSFLVCACTWGSLILWMTFLLQLLVKGLTILFLWVLTALAMLQSHLLLSWPALSRDLKASWSWCENSYVKSNSSLEAAMVLSVFCFQSCHKCSHTFILNSELKQKRQH